MCRTVFLIQEAAGINMLPPGKDIRFVRFPIRVDIRTVCMRDAAKLSARPAWGSWRSPDW